MGRSLSSEGNIDVMNSRCLSGGGKDGILRASAESVTGDKDSTFGTVTGFPHIGGVVGAEYQGGLYTVALRSRYASEMT